MNKIAKVLVFLIAGCSMSPTKAEEPFWPHGSASYTNKESWLHLCAENSYDDKKYLIGTDIVACVTKAPDGSVNSLIMSPAFNFSSSELAEMHSSRELSVLPPRNHSRFKCLRLTSGWMC